MKNKPKIRFKGFSNEWKKYKLKDMCNVITKQTGFDYSSTIKPSLLNFKTNNTYSFIQNKDFDGLNINLDTDFYVPIDIANKFPKILIDTPSLLISISGKIGNVGFYSLKNKAFIGGAVGICKLKSHENGVISTYVLQSDSCQKYFQSLIKASSHANITVKDIRNIEISLSASETENENITDFLFDLENLININQSKYNKLVNIKKSMLENLFPQKNEKKPQIRFKDFINDWGRHKFSEFGNVAMNKRIYKYQTTIDGEIPFYKIGTFGGVADAFISKKLFESFKNKYPYPKIGDILISASGSIGKTIQYNGEKAYFQDSNIVWLNHDNKIDNSFLKLLYCTVKWAGIEGSTIKRLYNSNILDTSFLCPEIDEQLKIGNIFKSIDNLITINKDELDKLKNIKKALLDKMFV